MAQLTPTLPGYRELELIAHGTTSLVFRAVQERLERTVAIKLLLVDQAVTTPEAVARELATMVRLSAQPHIVSIIDTGVTDAGQPYTVMDFCEGGSYAQILSDHGPLHVDDVTEVGIKIGEALHAAHGVGIIHRDVKPSNILRSQFGPALADFGIARAPEELASTLTREMMTPHHASPEALLHQAQSGPSDVYSLASTMWALLVGHPPYVDPRHPPQDLNAFRDRVLHDPLPALDRADIPDWLIAELTRAMAKLPAERHGSALEFAIALRRGALGLPPQSTPVRYPIPSGPAGTEIHTPGPPITAWPPLGPVPAQPVSAPPLSGQPFSGPPFSGPPFSGQPVSGQPFSGPPFSGQPVSGSPVSGPLVAAAPPTEVAPTEFAVRPVTVTSAAQAGRQPGPERSRAHVDTDERGQPSADGGWLARAGTPVRGPVEEAFDDSATALPAPRFDEVPARRGILPAALAGVAVIGLVAAGLLVARSNGAGLETGPPDTTEPTPSTTQFVTFRTEGGPTDVRIDDSGGSLTLRWRDPSKGGGQQLVLISRNGAQFEALPHMPLPQGATAATVPRPKPPDEYCFVVGLVISTKDIRRSPAVCTR